MNFRFNGDDNRYNNDANNNRDNRDNKTTENSKDNIRTKNKIIKIAKIILTVVLIAAGLFIFFNYVVFLVGPFIIAWIISLIIQPAINFFNTKLRIPKKLATILFIIILFLIFGLIIFLAIDRIIYELTAFSQNYSDKFTTASVSDNINDFFAWLEGILDNIPFFYDNNLTENIRETLISKTLEMLSQFGSNIVERIPSFIRDTAVAIPQGLVYTLITIIATFYISLDFGKINEFIAAQIPHKVRTVIYDLKSKFFTAIYKYLRAYSIIVLITYSELTVGFLIIGIKYAFIIAAITALLDILPIVGTGTVLIPWGIVCIVQKDFFTGFALLILYITITIIRNIIEAKIVGTSIGLYPVVTLMAMYAGFRVLGLVGMFLLPITILIIKNLNDEGKIRLWKNIDNPDDDSKKKKDRRHKSKKDAAQ